MSATMVDLQENWPYDKKCLASDLYLNIDGIDEKLPQELSKNFPSHRNDKIDEEGEKLLGENECLLLNLILFYLY